MVRSSRALALVLVVATLVASLVPLVHAHDGASAALYNIHCPFEALAGQAVALAAAPPTPSPGPVALLLSAAPRPGPRSLDAGLVLASRAPPA